MPSTDTTISSTDIYKINQFVDQVKAKYIDIPEDTLVLGVYGYLSAIISNALENSAVTSAEYSNEAIPTKAKFERNIISHALSLGIDKIFAVPSYIDILINLPESKILDNLIPDPDVVTVDGVREKNTFIIDKDFEFNIGEDQQYPFHLDYDIKVKRSRLPNGTYVYNAIYETNGWINNMVKLNNPYLPAIGVVNVEGDTMISIKTTLRQYTHSEIYKKIIVDNPLETKILNFSFEDQIVFFYVDVTETDSTTGKSTTHHLLPVYDGIYNETTNSQEYINFLFLDEKNIRLKFDRDVYQPRQNADVTIHVITTLGSECNFSMSKDWYQVAPFSSTRYSYDNLYYMIQAVSDSMNGQDKLSIEQLKTVIPQEAISRGSISTYTDLNNAFNAIQTPDIKMYFLRKIHNQIERLYYAYLLLRDSDNNIVPTNTATVKFGRTQFSSTSKYNFSLKPGSPIYYDPDEGTISCLAETSDGIDIAKYDKMSFLYTCPYLIVVNKSPFFVSYFMTIINYTRELYFVDINNKSLLQFITLNFNFHRDFYPTEDDGEITSDKDYIPNDNDVYHIKMNLTQNINTDYDLITYTESGAINQCLVDVYCVLYKTKSDGSSTYPFKYLKAKLYQFDEASSTFTFEFKFKTNDTISNQGNYLYITKGLKNVMSGVESETYVSQNMQAKFFIVAKFDQEYGRDYKINNVTHNLDDIIPNLEGYTLTNVYTTGDEGIDIFYDYSDMSSSYIEILRDEATKNNDYRIHKVPLIKYTYLNTEDRWISLNKMIDRRRRYIQDVLLLLEDSFGIDYKFYNTYGPSLMYNINNKENIDRINISLKFEIKFVSNSESVLLDEITLSIKDYIEDLNNITDLHMPNLITYITNLYRDHLVYIKFVRLNDYDSLYQSIYKSPKFTDNYFVETQTVPEFINVNTTPNNKIDIEFDVVS